MTLDEAQDILIDGGLVLETQGQGDMTRGHISIRVPGRPDHFYMKPHSFGFDEITTENIVTCDLEGEKISGGPRHSEVYIHSEIFRVRPDVTCVIHTHPVHAVAFSATGRALRPLSQPAAAFMDGLPVYTDTIDLIRSKEMGAGVAKALGPHKAVLLRNHGVAVVGSSLPEAVINATMLETACRIQLLVEAAGAIGAEFSADDVAKLREKICKPEQHDINFRYLVRKARRVRLG
jgi:ribulose-5-phosphate 4-epimerase/fuculose-1-phosphate aldolase